MSQEEEGTGSNVGLRSWLVAQPPWTLAALDLTGIALSAAAAAQLNNPDVLMHVVWIVLAIEAFAYGLRVVAVRIAAVTIFLVVYAFLANDIGTPFAVAMIDLDLEEWPLMVAIAVLVAILADRVTRTSRQYAALYRAASDRLLTAQEDERKRLSADLHDGVGQTMTAMVVTLDAAEAAFASPAIPDDVARKEVRRAREMASIALEDVRGVALRLRPARLQESGLVAAMRELAASAGMPVEFSADASLDHPRLLDPAREVDTYRIVQEAIGNASRHARPTRVEIRVERISRSLRVEVADDGVGFDPGQVAGRGLGLASMRERALAMGGTLDIRSRLGAGTRIRLDIPLADDLGTWTVDDGAAADVMDAAARAPGGAPAKLGAPTS